MSSCPLGEFALSCLNGGDDGNGDGDGDGHGNEGNDCSGGGDDEDDGIGGSDEVINSHTVPTSCQALFSTLL